MRNYSIALPFWARAFLLAGLAGIVLGAGLIAYRYYDRPTVLSVAVGSFDGEAAKVASVIAARLEATKSAVRLKIVPADNVLDSAKIFAEGKTDLAIVRADVGDLSLARSVALITKSVLMILALPGSQVTSIEKMKGHTVGVVGGEINQKIVEALKAEYDLGDKVIFKNMAPADTPGAIQSKAASAFVLVVPLSEKYISLVRRFFRGGHNSFPALIPVESAGAIADVEGAYESFDIPQGTLRGNPPVPDADLTTLRVATYLVANKKIDPDTITTLTQALVTARNDLVRDQPLLAGLTAPDTDPGAYIPVHPGAAAYYNGTQQSFMDKYGNWIYLTPMVLGALASIFATAWRFLGGRQEPAETTLRSLFALPRRIREVKSEAELTEIENQVDQALDAEMASAIRSENAQDISTLVSMAHRLEDSIYRRRQMLAEEPAGAIESNRHTSF
ncbi:ABC transporter substrate-binding protein [Bradyrhizobium sp. AUGA SZCCT0240]|uniref:TAXI family TRAP transporter solute-binding subunit n=1 Tax=unclassified Bradyrhizobium TaxID=2631580 RepID=UPI001BA571C1|nr:MULTISPECIES: TAXI family TRAP transporter solute-binding subunit [unclassified Bradyrhizobium]MBR1195641.1 ABC transporter substrate-binding protein [Bradyrhizobium sp. AUGA SZCCT0158]MBR1242607.1 ABC transporter substrate-binding protein [Bradyrhizobium sp. AUGA SZCCT0274]MBR1252413.1 ABC transporter substrate-binding protein [Bradyrhizobium sp. AUGA SZCCT0240]